MNFLSTAHLSDHLVFFSPAKLAVGAVAEGGEGGGGGAPVAVASTLVGCYHLPKKISNLVPLSPRMSVYITSVSLRLFKAALRLKKRAEIWI